MSSSDIQGLTEAQVRRVLERLNSLNPDFVQSVMSNVLDEDSVVTQRASNTTSSSSLYRTRLPPPQVYIEDEDDEPPPPLHRATSDEGDSKPLMVSNESVRHHKSDFGAQHDIEAPSRHELKPHDDENHLEARAACYLVEYDRQSGQLLMHYSLTPVEGALGVFYPADGHSIVAYGKSPIAGVSDNQQNYCSGWCQFVLTAKALDGTMTVVSPLLAADLYLYSAQNETIQVIPEKDYELTLYLAVACLPKDAPFCTEHLDIDEWMENAILHGAANRF